MKSVFRLGLEHQQVARQGETGLIHNSEEEFQSSTGAASRCTVPLIGGVNRVNVVSVNDATDQ